jgi:hypothetical protein
VALARGTRERRRSRTVTPDAHAERYEAGLLIERKADEQDVKSPRSARRHSGERRSGNVAACPKAPRLRLVPIVSATDCLSGVHVPFIRVQGSVQRAPRPS